MSLGVSNYFSGVGGATVPDGARAADEDSTRKEKSTWLLSADGTFRQEKEGITRCYTIDQKVGSGGFSNVWTIIPKEAKSGKTKIAKIARYYETELNHFPDEYLVSSKYPDKSVGLMLKTKAYLDNGKDKKILIMHKYDGDINIIISTMTKEEKIEAIWQLAKGLSTLHELGIIHGDFGFQNIFYHKIKNRYDIADFGYSIDVGSERFDSLNSDSLNDDIRHFKSNVECILVGKKVEFPIGHSCYKRSLKTEIDVMRLGYSEKVASLIIDFMNNTPDNMRQICEIFDKVKEAFEHSAPSGDEILSNVVFQAC